MYTRTGRQRLYDVCVQSALTDVKHDGRPCSPRDDGHSACATLSKQQYLAMAPSPRESAHMTMYTPLTPAHTVRAQHSPVASHTTLPMQLIRLDH